MLYEVITYDVNDKYTGEKIGNINFIVLQSQLKKYFSQFSTHENDIIGIVDNNGNEIVTYPYKNVEEINLSKVTSNSYFENNALIMKAAIDSEWNIYQKMSLKYMYEESYNFV